MTPSSQDSDPLPPVDLFRGRVAILATMHQKEKAISPLIEPALGLSLRVPSDFNTDAFGTFTREIARTGNQLAAARRKAEAAMNLTGEALALASEGSFGPHPGLPCLAYNRELVLLRDRRYDLEVVGQAVTTATNYSHKLVTTPAAAQEFATQIGFPEHGLVVITDPQTPRTGEIFKGITSFEQLATVVEQALSHSPSGKVHLETDMRALYNPTRMQVIAQATQNLLDTLNRVCPRCGWPGFELCDTLTGLPCEWCGSPTSLVRSQLYGCKKCDFRQETLYPEGRETADPAHCTSCNP